MTEVSLKMKYSLKTSRAEARKQAINTVGGVKRYITVYICTLPLASIYIF